MPAGTLFMKYEPCSFGDLQSKGETWELDFLSENITYEIDCTNSNEFSDKLHSAKETGENLRMDFDITSRDGCFDDNQLFAVYDKRDVEMLTDKLNRCVKSAYTKKVEV